MHRKTATILFAAALAGLFGGIARQSRGAGQIPTADRSLSGEERARLLTKGKELFLSRCVRCHGENGDKPLKTGVPLSERGLSSDAIAQAVNGRLRDSASLFVGPISQAPIHGLGDSIARAPALAQGHTRLEWLVSILPMAANTE